MIIGFTGHRDKLCNNDSLFRIEERYPGATWVHGGAFGFDSQVNDVALALGKVLGDTLIVIRPDYKRYASKVAPLVRNTTIVDMSDLMVACFDGRRKGGTHHCVGYAKYSKKPIEYVTPIASPKVPL